MNSTQHQVPTAGRTLAGLLVLGALLLSPAAFAGSTDLQDLAKKPESYLGQDVEITGVCVKHGRKGDVLGYECTTEEGVYVDARDVEPEAAKKKLDAGCDGDDCSVTIRFVPHSYSTSSMVEPGKDVTIFNAQKATVSSGN
jgi:hypothetical protein